MRILLKAKLSFGNLLRKMNNGGEISMLESVGPCSRILNTKNKATRLLTIRDLRPLKH
jgi:hypothetical protein